VGPGRRLSKRRANRAPTRSTLLTLAISKIAMKERGDNPSLLLHRVARLRSINRINEGKSLNG
jgi:hypothetical protein